MDIMQDEYSTQMLAPDAAGIARAAELLRARRLVALPTETVYGLAARADDDAAVAAIYRAKGRPDTNPLIVHVASLDQARKLAVFSPMAVRVAKACWPGPLTLILPKRPDAPLAGAVSAGLATVAIRIPDHPQMRAVLAQCPFALAAPSANMSEGISPTTAAHVAATLDGRIHAVLDGGATGKGLESTILAIRNDGSWAELRPGPVDSAALHLALTGRPIVRAAVTGSVEAPGQMTRHYSPGKPVRLNASGREPDEFLIGLGAMDANFSLSPTGDLAEAASNLYAALHCAALSHYPRIAVGPVPSLGIGAAINDRLRRAAA